MKNLIAKVKSMYTDFGYEVVEYLIPNVGLARRLAKNGISLGTG